MPLMNVRFVVTGACYVAYSGRQIFLEIPATQPDGHRTTVADVEAQVRRSWPEDFSEMAESIGTVGMKILKTGRLLKDSDIFEEQLTQAERTECEVDSTEQKTRQELEKSSVLMHLVFQREAAASEPSGATPSSPKKSDPPADARRRNDGAGSPNSSSGGASNGRNDKGDNCCSVM